MAAFQARCQEPVSEQEELGAHANKQTEQAAQSAVEQQQLNDQGSHGCVLWRVSIALSNPGRLHTPDCTSA